MQKYKTKKPKTQDGSKNEKHKITHVDEKTTFEDNQCWEVSSLDVFDSSICTTCICPMQPLGVRNPLSSTQCYSGG